MAYDQDMGVEKGDQREKRESRRSRRSRGPAKGDLALDVERLTAAPEERIFEVSGDWWAARDPLVGEGRCEVEVPFHFDLQASRIGQDVVLEGSLAGRVGLECSRCAKRYSHALRDEFRLQLEPAEGQEPQDPEGLAALAATGLCLAEDLEAGWFRGPWIRLDDFFGEVIALAWPIQPLCNEDCPGLCPRCGADRASIRCDCPAEDVERRMASPFAVLAGLKNELESER